MGEIVLQAAYFIAHLLLDLLGYYTAKALLPLVSFSFLQVQPLSARNPAAWWWQRPFARLPSGRVEVSIAMASLIGLLLWGVLIVSLVLQYKATLS